MLNLLAALLVVCLLTADAFDPTPSKTTRPPSNFRVSASQIEPLVTNDGSVMKYSVGSPSLGQSTESGSRTRSPGRLEAPSQKVTVVEDKTAMRSETQLPVRARSHRKWGVDNDHQEEYWFDSRIHTLGNCGFSGALHAALAPISTKVIDVAAYDGVDIRALVAQELSTKVNKAVGDSKARVLDLCCGVGISTRALAEAFPSAETVMGMDTSAEMVAMAKFLQGHVGFFRFFRSTYDKVNKKLSVGYITVKDQGRKIKNAMDAATFVRGNAEDTDLPDKSFDLVTVMYAFHEAPKEGRHNIISEARRLLQPGGTLAVVDISTDYSPSKSMLAGEPYVLDYQETIQKQLNSFKGFRRAEYKTLVPGHVGMWLLKRTSNTVE